MNGETNDTQTQPKPNHIMWAWMSYDSAARNSIACNIPLWDSWVMEMVTTPYMLNTEINTAAEEETLTASTLHKLYRSLIRTMNEPSSSKFLNRYMVSPSMFLTNPVYLSYLANLAGIDPRLPADWISELLVKTDELGWIIGLLDSSILESNSYETKREKSE